LRQFIVVLRFLIRSRASIYTRRFRKVLSQLITITWESAVPPCGCAIAALIVCVRNGPFVSYWAVFLQVILGKLYLISLFATLMERGPTRQMILRRPTRQSSLTYPWHSCRVRRSLPTTQLKLKAHRIVHKHKWYNLTDGWRFVSIVSADPARCLWILRRLRSAPRSTFFSTAQ